MDKQRRQADAHELYERLKRHGLSADAEQRVWDELNASVSHDPPPAPSVRPGMYIEARSMYDYADMKALEDGTVTTRSPHLGLTTIDELLERDRQREKDGFPRKVRIGRLIRPGKGRKNAIVVVPTTVEEKFIHDRAPQPDGEGQAGGAGEGQEGEVIGEQPVRPEQGDGTGAGQGDGSSHEMDSNAYDLGRILTEKFELPNLRDKGTKRSLTRYTYDITDKHRGFGQVLDKKATLRQILETNIGLGRIPDMYDIDTTGLLVSPQDRIYRVLSREKDYESQALVFFVRDYSGSMAGKCTEVVVSQHVLIYSWLLYQYSKRVESRFILHDTDAKEVPDFHTYYNSAVAGGTHVASAYRLVNRIVEEERLARDYNIYVFHGTDGDDWDASGQETIPELKQILTYASRVGVSIVHHSYASGGKTQVQQYLEQSKLLEERADLVRLDTMSEDADETRIIDGIKTLLSQEAPARA